MKRINQIGIIYFVMFQCIVFCCDCNPYPPPSEEFQKRPVVFIGIVQSIIQVDYYNTVTLTVLKSWKGVSSNTVTLKTANNSGACGISFFIADTFLVYADTSKDIIYTHLCTRTKNIARATDDLAYLKTLGIKNIEGLNGVNRRPSISCYPNPSNPSTSIRFVLNKPSFTKISLFNYVGQLIETVYEGDCESGVNEILYDTSRLSSGVYVLRLTADKVSLSTKLINLK